MIPAFVFWLYALAGATHAGFYADNFDLQAVIMGGALSTIAALLLNIEALDI